jgi:hypothetical protein
MTKANTTASTISTSCGDSSSSAPKPHHRSTSTSGHRRARQAQSFRAWRRVWMAGTKYHPATPKELPR